MLSSIEVKRKPIPRKLSQQVYEKYNGHCAYWGCDLEKKDMQEDHIKCFNYHGDNLDIDKLNPSCRACNYYKGTYDLERFRFELGKLKERLQKVFIYKLAVKYGIVTENDNPITFYFERQEVHIEHNRRV